LITKDSDNLNLNKPGENNDTVLMDISIKESDVVVKKLIIAISDINYRKNEINDN
jgi:hypothetical protein